jgi:hypothetical protein
VLDNSWTWGSEWSLHSFDDTTLRILGIVVFIVYVIEQAKQALSYEYSGLVFIQDLKEWKLWVLGSGLVNDNSISNVERLLSFYFYFL